MGHVFPRDFNSPPIFADHSANELIVSVSSMGHYDDLSAGAGITCLGHSNDIIKQAMHDQIYQLPYVHAMNWTSIPAERLAALLIELTAGKLKEQSKFWGGQVIFLNTGAEAVEAACKVAAQVAYEQKLVPYTCAREYSYHGNTFFTLALGDHPKKTLYPGIVRQHVQRFGAYRPSVSPGYDLSSLARILDSTFLSNEKPVVVIEPVGGTTLGIEPSSTEYLCILSEICEKKKAILIYDEVLCGNYRTGELFAYQYYEAPEPDIICLGKGLTGGYFPLSAVIVSKPLVDVIRNGSGKLWHSTTNQNHPIGCAAGIAALGEYERIKPNLPKFGADLQQMVTEVFTDISSPLPHVIISGVGSLLGLRLDPGLPGFHLAVRREALKQGIAVYTDGGTINGKGNMVLLAPPYSYMEDMPHLEACLGKLKVAIQKAMEVC